MADVETTGREAASIGAYDLPERVRRYDADMDIMHPLRSKMIEIALEVLPFASGKPLRALDLGVGTGVFSEKLLEAFPETTLVAIDGAEAMLELAAARLGDRSDRVTWVKADFLALPDELTGRDSFDLVISSYALHHLSAGEKLGVLRQVAAALAPGGWLVNADIVVGETEEAEARQQELRVAGVTRRAPDDDERFRSLEATRATLDAAEHDQPQKLSTDLRILREAGIGDAEVFWKEYREAVTGGARCV